MRRWFTSCFISLDGCNKPCQSGRMKYDREIEQARWEALATALGVTVEALIVWYCREIAFELDEDAAPLQ
jgi:hypothetical protein